METFGFCRNNGLEICKITNNRVKNVSSFVLPKTLQNTSKTYLVDLPNWAKYLGHLSKTFIGCPLSVMLRKESRD